MPTVYFDTNFYVWIASAETTVAEAAVDELNRLQVRTVLSETVLFELFKNDRCPDRDRLLVDRVARFWRPPFCAGSELRWEALLATGEERSRHAEKMKAMDAASTHASAVGQVAAEPKPNTYDETGQIVLDERTQQLLSSNIDVLRETGMLDEDGNLDFNQMMSWCFTMLRDFGVPLPEELTPETAQQLQEDVYKTACEKSGSDIVDLVINRQTIHRQATAGDDRAFEVATGTHRGTYANTGRDAERMAHFIRFQSEIDFLQMDGPQFNLLAQAGDENPLVAHGLRERCFRASNLEGAVKQVRRLCSSCEGVTT